MTARDKIGHALRFANRKGPKKGPGAMPQPPIVASAGISPSPAVLAAASSATPMFGTLQAMQAQQQAISCPISMQTMTILRGAGLHPAMLQQAAQQKQQLLQMPQVQPNASQGNQIAAANNFMTQVRQLAIQQPLPITSKDCTQQTPHGQSQVSQQGGVPQVSGPFTVSELVSELVSDLPPRPDDLEPKRFKTQDGAKLAKHPPAHPDNILEQAKQHLVQAFNQCTTPTNVQQPPDSVSVETRNLTSQILQNTLSIVTTSQPLQNTKGVVTTTSSNKTPLSPGVGSKKAAAGNTAGKVRSSSSVASECEDLFSIMQDSIDTMETIEETCWERLNDPSSVAGLKSTCT